MTPEEQTRVRNEIRAIMYRLVFRKQEPDPARFRAELVRVLRAGASGEDVLAVMTHAVAGVPVVGERIAHYLAGKRDEVLRRVTPQLRLLKGGDNADAA